MKYQNIKKYKYKLKGDGVVINTGFTLPEGIEHPYFSLDDDGFLSIYSGYLWDGVSGPTWDSDNTMLGGLVHDALYQMIRLELLPLSYKDQIDKLFYDIIVKEGMNKFRAGYYLKAVELFGASSCVPGDVKIPKVISL